jgi:ribulose-phosphate 3-epimerase
MSGHSRRRTAELPQGRLLAEISLWSADLGHLADEIGRVEEVVDMFHIDASDGHFSPALLFFPDLVAVVRRLSAKPIHVHLMATDDILVEQIDQFAAAGADLISIHAENKHIDAALVALDERGVEAGLVLQLDTPIAVAAPYLHRISEITLLGTRIGLKGQDLDQRAHARLQAARALLDGQGSGMRIIVAADGGIREHTVAGLRKAGADAVVLGSLAFDAKDVVERVRWVQTLGYGAESA